MFLYFYVCLLSKHFYIHEYKKSQHFHNLIYNICKMIHFFIICTKLIKRLHVTGTMQRYVGLRNKVVIHRTHRGLDSISGRFREITLYSTVSLVKVHLEQFMVVRRSLMTVGLPSPSRPSRLVPTQRRR